MQTRCKLCVCVSSQKDKSVSTRREFTSTCGRTLADPCPSPRASPRGLAKMKWGAVLFKGRTRRCVQGSRDMEHGTQGQPWSQSHNNRGWAQQPRRRHQNAFSRRRTHLPLHPFGSREKALHGWFYLEQHRVEGLCKIKTMRHGGRGGDARNQTAEGTTVANRRVAQGTKWWRFCNLSRGVIKDDSEAASGPPD